MQLILGRLAPLHSISGVGEQPSADVSSQGVEGLNGFIHCSAEWETVPGFLKAICFSYRSFIIVPLPGGCQPGFDGF